MVIAGKMMKRVLALSIAIMVLFSFSAYADVVITDPANHTVGDPNALIKVTVTGATAGEEVALLIYEGSVSPETILYVDQKTASGTSVDFTFGIRDGFNKAASYTIKAGSTKSAAADSSTLVFEEIKVNGIVVTAPTTTVYSINGELDTTGMAVYEALNGEALGDALDASAYTVSTVDTTTAGAKLVVVTATAGSDSFAIFVKPAETITEAAPVAVESVTVAEEDKAVEVKLNETAELVYEIAPVDAANKDVEWISLDAEIATVENGVVTGVGLGATKVIGLTKSGAFSFAYDVNVVNADIEEGFAGQIVDGDTGVGVYGATLTYEDYMTESVITATTDANGYFKLPVGTLSADAFIAGKMVITKDGYITREYDDYEMEATDAIMTIGADGITKLFTNKAGDSDNDGKVGSNDLEILKANYGTGLEYGNN